MLRNKKYIISAVVAAVIIVLTAVCGFSLSASRVDRGRVNAVTDSFGEERDYRYLEKRGSMKVASLGGNELYFDKKTGAVSLYDKDSGKSWSSLPSEKNNAAANLYVKVYDGKNYIILDSQSDCAAQKGLRYKETDNGIHVDYTLKKGEVSVEIPVDYSLSGAYLEAEADISACRVSDGVKIISVSVLPFMGSVSYSSESFDMSMAGDWFLVPDGAGAIISTAIENDEHSEYTYSVYAKKYYEDSAPASVGAFGIKQTDFALGVCLAEGEENALIRVVRSNADSSNINRIYPEFIITPVSGDSGNVRFGTAYDGKIRVLYEALSGETATYTGVASSVRQALINEGFMSTEAVQQEYPFFVSLQINSPDGSGVLSGFAQAENLLTLLKAKGVDEINLILRGMHSSSAVRSSVSSGGISASGGGSSAFSELCSYAMSQNLNVFSAVQLFSSSSTGGSRDISGDRNTYLYKNSFYPYSGKEYTKMTYFREADISRAVISTMKELSEYDCGIAVTDNNILYGDFSGGISYTAMSEKIGAMLSSLTTRTKTVLSSANMNTIGYGDYIYNVSAATYYPEGNDYLQVPFIPAVIHSSVSYALTPANEEAYAGLSLLRAVEYGAALHYLWCFDEGSDKYYDHTLSYAAEFYTEAYKNLADLSAKRITDHFMHENGVYCTVYENGARVYVNYNNYSVIIGEVAVMPYNYLRIG